MDHLYVLRMLDAQVVMRFQQNESAVVTKLLGVMLTIVVCPYVSLQSKRVGIL